MSMTVKIACLVFQQEFLRDVDGDYQIALVCVLDWNICAIDPRALRLYGRITAHLHLVERRIRLDR